MGGSRLWEVGLEEQIGRVCTRASECTIWLKEGGDALGLLAMEDSHKAAGRLRTRGPCYVVMPGSTATAFTCLLYTSDAADE